MPEPTPQKTKNPATASKSGDAATAATADVLRYALLELRIELSIANRRVAAVTGLRESDLDVLDVLTRYGPQSPTALARRMGIHPATMTGVLTRLEKTGWLVRRRDVTDRRSVQVESSGFDRLTDLYSDATARIDQINDQLTPEAAAVIGDYLKRIGDAVHEASQQLGAGDTAP